MERKRILKRLYGEPPTKADIRSLFAPRTKREAKALKLYAFDFEKYGTTEDIQYFGERFYYTIDPHSRGPDEEDDESEPNEQQHLLEFLTYHLEVAFSASTSLTYQQANA